MQCQLHKHHRPAIYAMCSSRLKRRVNLKPIWDQKICRISFFAVVESMAQLREIRILYVNGNTRLYSLYRQISQETVTFKAFLN
jgi:hypothetical protein